MSSISPQNCQNQSLNSLRNLWQVWAAMMIIKIRLGSDLPWLLATQGQTALHCGVNTDCMACLITATLFWNCPKLLANNNWQVTYGESAPKSDPKRKTQPTMVILGQDHSDFRHSFPIILRLDRDPFSMLQFYAMVPWFPGSSRRPWNSCQLSVASSVGCQCVVFATIVDSLFPYLGLACQSSHTHQSAR